MQKATATKHLNQLLKKLEEIEARKTAHHGPPVPRTSRAFDAKTIAALKVYTGGHLPKPATPTAAPCPVQRHDGPDAYLAGITAKR